MTFLKKENNVVEVIVKIYSLVGSSSNNYN